MESKNKKRQFLLIMSTVMDAQNRLVKAKYTCMVISEFYFEIGTVNYIFTLCRLINIGQITNGLMGCAVVSGAPIISAVWFPVHQRTTATGITFALGGLGPALSSVIGTNYYILSSSNVTRYMFPM